MAAVQHSTVAELAEQLSEGFTALTGEYQLLFAQHRQLESKLSFAKQQYLELLKKCSPEAVSHNHIAFLHGLESVGSEHGESQVDWKEQLCQADDPERRNRGSLIKKALSSQALLSQQKGEDQVKIWSGPSADKHQPAAATVDNTVGKARMEMDFTTPGTPSKLGCPFASSSGKRSSLVTPRSSTSRSSLRGRRSKRPSFNDPIRAEICGNDIASASASIEGSAAVCPIRFLDQHAPEEVAQYFEKHKHEIPRSHEVCIKRFQTNAESIRQLDAKYGSLVNMVQGLGLKHQPMLPKEPEEDVLEDGESDEKVEKWATAVSTSLEDHTEDEPESSEQVLDETRTAHFDRPLKEIRVGESPSRPWGISVPSKYAQADSASVESAPTASPQFPPDGNAPQVPESSNKPSKCPFNHGATKSTVPVETFDGTRSENEPPREPESHHAYPNQPAHQEQGQQVPDAPKPYPQIVFNGPVFIGYPPDQAMNFFQQSAFGRT